MPITTEGDTFLFYKKNNTKIKIYFLGILFGWLFILTNSSTRTLPDFYNDQKIEASFFVIIRDFYSLISFQNQNTFSSDHVQLLFRLKTFSSVSQN